MRQTVFHQLVDANGAAKIRQGHADPADHAQLRAGHGLATGATRNFSRRARPPLAAPSWTGSIPTISSWSWPHRMTTNSQSIRCCRCTPRPWAIRRWGRRRILIGPRRRKIPSRRWDIIFQDSTHIAADVVTLGITHRILQAGSFGFSWARTRRIPLEHQLRERSIRGRPG